MAPGLGEIEPIVMKQGVMFRRGFLACAREGEWLRL